MITKIISGGQTGADQGGLFAANKLGISTGGWCPKDYMTEDGPNIQLRLYNLVPTLSDKYNKRTELNVKESDGTLIFNTVNSPGTASTLRYLLKHKKPFIVNPSLQEFIAWIKNNDIEVLNVAGNRESKSPGICEKVRQFLVDAIPLANME